MAIIVLSLQHGFRVAGGCACGRTKGLSDRPLETFGSHLSLLSFIESFLVSVLFVPPCNMKNQVTSGGAGEAVQRATAKPSGRSRRSETSARIKFKCGIIIIPRKKSRWTCSLHLLFSDYLTSSQNLSMFPLTTSRLERQKSGFRTSIPTLAATSAIVPEPQERSRRQ